MGKEPLSPEQCLQQEAEWCAEVMFRELTGGQPRLEYWYLWFLCERHGGPPLLDRGMPWAQIAYWDGEDIMVDVNAPSDGIAAALPEELAHRLSSRETPRFESLNYYLSHASRVERERFQEMVGQRVAVLFALRRQQTTSP